MASMVNRMHGNNAWIARALFGASLLAVAIVDYLSGAEINALLLYFVPLLIAAWYLPLTDAIIAALLATAAWTLTQYVAGERYSAPQIWAINVVMLGAVFLLVTVLFARLRAARRATQELRRTDTLTGLPDSRSFFERAGSVLAMCHRNAQPATLAYIDLDNFRKANEKHGHAGGDRLLRKVADVLNENMRTSDIAARIGADEFVMLLPETGEDTAAVALEKVRNRIARAEEFMDSNITASIGAVTCAPAPPDINGMLRAADRLMSRVKSGSGNHVLVQGMDRA